MVEKLVAGDKAPLSPRIQIGWDTYLVKMLYLHDQILNTYNPRFD